MKQLIRLAALLYPRRWRARYGAEFEALLEDSTPDLRTSLDVLKGAILMRLTGWSSFRILLAGSVLGAVLAFAYSFSIPRQYVSLAAVRVTYLDSGPSQKAQMVDRMNWIVQAVRSRVTLTRLIVAHDLYRTERNSQTFIEILDFMNSNLQIDPIPGVIGGGTPLAFQLRFSYPDRILAQRVMQDLLTYMIDAGLNQEAPKLSSKLELFEPPNLPQVPVSPNVTQITAVGIALGLTLSGGLIFLRHRHRFSPQLAALAITSPERLPAFPGTEVPIDDLFADLQAGKTLDQFAADSCVTREAAVAALQLAKSMLVRGKVN